MVYITTKAQACRLYSNRRMNMKKTMTIKQIDRSAAALQQLQSLKKHWPVKVNYAIAKNLKVLMEELNVYIAQKEDVIQNNVLKDEKGNPIITEDKSYKFPDGKKSEVVKEIDEMYNMETDIDVHMIKMEDISVCDTDSRYDGTTLEDIAAIEFMIQE